MTVDVLLLGNGGREHALAWKLRQSPRLGKLFITSGGNAGTAQLGENISIESTDIGRVAQFAYDNNIGLTIASSDNPLALGIVDIYQARGLKIFGPTYRASRIESSKVFAKDLMRRNRIPTALCKCFDSPNKALRYAETLDRPVVVKADGLAQGKGAYICQTSDMATDAVRSIMVEGLHGGAGKQIVIEDFVEGQEVSLHAFCDTRTFSIFPVAQDHKPVFENDEGPMTGGMGTIAPVPWITQAWLRTGGQEIVRKILNALAEQEAPFAGCLFPGLKMSPKGPKVLECNARFGDPETQVYMRLLETDLLNILLACTVPGGLKQIEIKWKPVFAVCIVLCSSGYPGEPQKGVPIFGIEDAERIPDVVVFHAGTIDDGGQIRTNGGRILGVTVIHPILETALNKAYRAAKLIQFEGKHYRQDIGAKSLAMC